MQVILDNITRNIQINGSNYYDCKMNNKLSDGDYIDVIIADVDLELIQYQNTYTFILSDSFIGETENQIKFSCKWNKGTIIYDKYVIGKYVASRDNMIKIDTETSSYWLLKSSIERVY